MPRARVARRPQRIAAGIASAQDVGAIDRASFNVVQEREAAELQGFQLPGYRLITSVDSPYGLRSSDVIVDARTNLGHVTALLPRAKAVRGRLIIFKKLSGLNTLTIRAEGGDTILRNTTSGVTSVSLTAAGSFLWLASDGQANWLVVAE